MARKKTPQEVGKDFEEETRLALKEITRHHKAMFHRFYDTRSAGTYLPNQPGDFLFMFLGKVYLIECKSSEKHPTLSAALSSVMEQRQAPIPLLWMRAGAGTLVLFLDQTNNEVELWDGSLVYRTRAQERGRLPAEGYVCRFPRSALQSYLLIEFRGRETL